MQLWFDFLCPFARIGSLWLREVQSQGELSESFEWKTLSLEQINLDVNSDPDELWSAPDFSRGLFALAACKWAQNESDEVWSKVQRALFDAGHVDRVKIGRLEVISEVLSAAGLGGPSIADQISSDPRWLKEARSDHDEGAELGIFGVPTLVVDGAAPMFFRLSEVTTGDRAVSVYKHVIASVKDPVIHELKRPSKRQ